MLAEAQVLSGTWHGATQRGVVQRCIPEKPAEIQAHTGEGRGHARCMPLGMGRHWKFLIWIAAIDALAVMVAYPLGWPAVIVALIALTAMLFYIVGYAWITDGKRRTGTLTTESRHESIR
jgi:hypothetical protein